MGGRAKINFAGLLILCLGLAVEIVIITKTLDVVNPHGERFYWAAKVGLEMTVVAVNSIIPLEIVGKIPEEAELAAYRPAILPFSLATVVTFFGLALVLISFIPEAWERIREESDGGVA